MLHDVTCQKPESSLTIVRMTCTAVRSGPKGPCTALALAAFSCRYTRLAPTVPGEWALQPLFSWSYRLTHSVYSIEVLLYIIWTSMIWWCIHTTSYKIIQIFLHLVTYKYIYNYIYALIYIDLIWLNHEHILCMNPAQRLIPQLWTSSPCPADPWRRWLRPLVWNMRKIF